MKITIDFLLHQPYLENSTLYEENCRRTNVVDGVTFFEEITKDSMILKGNLVFLDQNILSDMECTRLHSYADYYHKLNVAGICVSNYRECEIDEFYDELAAKKIPVILMPLGIIMSVVISGISYDILRAKGYNLLTSYEDNFFQELIFTEQDRQIYLKRARMMGIRVDEHLCVIMIRPHKAQFNRDEYARELLELCKKEWNDPCFVISRNGNVLLIGRTDLPYSECAAYFSAKTRSLFEKITAGKTGTAVDIGLGHCYENITNLRNSYFSARTALLAASLNTDRQNIVSYDELGIYQILYDVKNRDKLAEMVDKTVRTIIAYDEENQTDFYDTIEAYLNHFLSVQHTANAMSIRYNTVRYRITRIKEIFGWDLFNLDDCIYLAEGLKAYKFINAEFDY